LGRRVGDAVGTRKETVEVVEAAVFRIDDDDVLDPLETALGRRGRRRAAGGCEDRRRQRQRAFQVLRQVTHRMLPPALISGSGAPANLSTLLTNHPHQPSTTLARTVPALSWRASTSTRSPRLPRTIHSIFARSSVTL